METVLKELDKYAQIEKRLYEQMHENKKRSVEYAKANRHEIKKLLPKKGSSFYLVNDDILFNNTPTHYVTVTDSSLTTGGNRSTIIEFKPTVKVNRYSAEDKLLCKDCISIDELGNPYNPATKDSYIYLIKAIGRPVYKIGKADDPYKRIQQLQTGSPERLMIIDTFLSTEPLRTEAMVHSKYKDYRMSGEWFNLEGVNISEVKEYIQEINQ